MQMRKSQSVADVILRIPLLYNNGSAAAGFSLATLSTKIIKPDGTALVGYDEATFSEPNGDGVYVVKFPSTAANKAFTVVDAANPYTVTLDSTVANVDPMAVDVFIVSKMPWELARPEDILVDPATDRIDGSLIDAAVASRPTLMQIEGSSILAKEATVSTRASQASLDQKPTLSEIEASSVLAREQTLSQISSDLSTASNSLRWSAFQGMLSVQGWDGTNPNPITVSFSGYLNGGAVDLRAVRMVQAGHEYQRLGELTDAGFVKDPLWTDKLMDGYVLYLVVQANGTGEITPGTLSIQVNASELGDLYRTVLVNLPRVANGAIADVVVKQDGTLSFWRAGNIELRPSGATLSEIEGSQVLAKERTLLDLQNYDLFGLDNWKLGSPTTVSFSPSLSGDAAITLYADYTGYDPPVPDQEIGVLSASGWAPDPSWNGGGARRLKIRTTAMTTGFPDGVLSITYVADTGQRTIDVAIPGIPADGGGQMYLFDKNGQLVHTGSARRIYFRKTPNLSEIEGSAVLAKEATVSTRASQTSVDAKPALADIEGSPVLGKESTSQAIKADIGAIRTGVPCTELTAEAKAQVNAEVVDALDVDAYPELVGTPAPPWTFRKMVQWLFQYFKHPRRMTDVEEKLYQADGATVAGTRTVSETQTEVSLGKMS